MAYLKVEGHDSLVRNTNHGGIVNTNKSDYEIYMQRHRARQTNIDQIRDTVKEINSLKQEMFEIKQMILELGKKHGC